MACSTGCRTKDHASFAACMRSKRPATAGLGSQDRTAQQKWDRDLDAYRDARRQGIQPAATSRASVDRAVAISDATGTAYQG